MPPKTKHQVHPIDERDLVCLTCNARCPWMDSPEATQQRARAAGWHVYAGDSVAGSALVRVYCDQCFNRGGPQRPRGAHVLDGQMDLLGSLEEK